MEVIRPQKIICGDVIFVEVSRCVKAKCIGRIPSPPKYVKQIFRCRYYFETVVWAIYLCPPFYIILGTALVWIGICTCIKYFLPRQNLTGISAAEPRPHGGLRAIICCICVTRLTAGARKAGHLGMAFAVYSRQYHHAQEHLENHKWGQALFLQKFLAQPQSAK